MIITVKVGNMGSRQEVTVNTETTTPRQAFEQAGIDPSSGMVSLNSMSLRPGEVDQTFDQLGVQTNCTLSAIVKADSAAI